MNRESLNRTLNYMRERKYSYGEIDDKSVVIASSKDTAKSDAFLVSLGRMVRRSVANPQTLSGGPSIHLGPIRPEAIPNFPVLHWANPSETFLKITSWMSLDMLPPTGCLGWANDLPDWLEIASAKDDIKSFAELWNQRPEEDYLKKIVCMIYDAY